ncbi:hypothetical protein F0P96_03990 [Hymenobacter busanensis]|uniref:Uncharacterized protein n=1 Tax=Hymenobacter busanensis TaxID=2607656 RepID=A0A7L4ZSY8_9BACT|nr:hypothetical protein [Hymenobacter busanensis]KAA9339786.1 hypothetical protein F0P96_03990 [Hymenobacter busanensis]QHJ06459.1 hypothetical protein GUY19_03755 [Hymenobacter busanensis]
MKAFLIAAFCCCLSIVANAQMRDRQPDMPNQSQTVQADDLTRQMANRLHLNEAQYIKLRAANQIKLAKMDEIQWQFQQDPDTRNAKLIELEAQYEQECQRIFTPSQLSVWREETPANDAPAATDPNQNRLG